MVTTSATSGKELAMIQRYYALRPAMRGSRTTTKRTWDAICIGSGMGSLAAAGALAMAGRSVLILEAHTQFGGLTHTFQRKKVRWGTGLHYTGWPTSYYSDFPELWKIFTRGQAPWSRLPEETDHYIHPDGVFVKRSPRDRYRADLLAAFPGEQHAIDRYLTDLREMTASYLRFMTLQALPPTFERLGLGWWLGRRFLAQDQRPLKQYMDDIGASQKLRQALWFNWGNFGGIPGQTSIGAFAIPNEFMADGLWTLANGARSAAEAFAETILANGGEMRRGAQVTGLVFENGRVVGVQVGDEQIRARVVISGIGARETFHTLVPPDHQPRHAQRLIHLQPSCSLFTLYMALDRQIIDRFKFNAVNYWVEAERGRMEHTWDDLDHPPGNFLLSLAPRFQNESADDTVFPAEVFAAVSGEQFRRWQGTKAMKRGPEYGELKQQLTDRILERVEQTWPGFRQYVRHVEGASPLTIQSYTRHFDGAAYGIAPALGRYSERALRCVSGVPGLYLSGQDVSASGVIGAFYGGLSAASAVLLRNVPKMLLSRSR